MQAPPSGVHIGLPQTPLEQTPVQHSESIMQVCPSGLQTTGPQTLLLH